MNSKTNTGIALNLRLFSLLFSIFFISSGSYVIVPLLPIYFVESFANGGLAWSRADAFSLFGTFLALIYVSPFFGGLLGDFVIGKSFTALLGYGLTTSGLIVLYSFTSKEVISLALLALALGFGFVKVNLTASIGRLPDAMHQKGYEYYYLAASLGFIIGGLFSNPIFTSYAMTGVVTASLSCTIASICLFFGFFGKEVFRRSLKAPSLNSGVTTSSAPSARTFLLLIVLGIPFFICANQLTTGLSVFVHQCVNRTVGSWTVPTLWFASIGSLTMTAISPWLRKAWRSVNVPSRRIESLKFSAGFMIIGMAFAFAAAFAGFGPGSSFSHLGVPLLLCIYVMCCIADFHIRPLLFSAATSMISPRYHTLSTAVVYSSVGLGGKLAGTLASCVDAVGFSLIFAICSSIAIFCGAVSFIWWKVALVHS